MTTILLLWQRSVPEWLTEFDEVTDKRLLWSLWDLIKCRIRKVLIKYSKEKAHRKVQGHQPYIIRSWKHGKWNMILSTNRSQKGPFTDQKPLGTRKAKKSNIKYFLDLVTHKSFVRTVFNNEGVLIRVPKKDLQEIHTLYSSLCKRRCSQIVRGNVKIPKFTNNEACTSRIL